MGEDERKGRGAAPFVLWFWVAARERVRGGCEGKTNGQREGGGSLGLGLGIFCIFS
jgi:hypothetical protein